MNSSKFCAFMRSRPFWVAQEVSEPDSTVRTAYCSIFRFLYGRVSSGSGSIKKRDRAALLREEAKELPQPCLYTVDLYVPFKRTRFAGTLIFSSGFKSFSCTVLNIFISFYSAAVHKIRETARILCTFRQSGRPWQKNQRFLQACPF